MKLSEVPTSALSTVVGVTESNYVAQNSPSEFVAGVLQWEKITLPSAWPSVEYAFQTSLTIIIDWQLIVIDVNNEFAILRPLSLGSVFPCNDIFILGDADPVGGSSPGFRVINLNAYAPWMDISYNEDSEILFSCSYLALSDYNATASLYAFGVKS